jgi:ATP-dependent 26S proteasome regulatory subunit
MTAKTNAQKQAEFRARAKEAGMAEVRGIIAPIAHHDQIKEAIRKVANKLKTADAKAKKAP